MTPKELADALNQKISGAGVTLDYTSHGKTLQGKVIAAVHDTSNDTVILEWESLRGAPQLPHHIVPGDVMWNKLIGVLKEKYHGITDH